MRIKELRAAAGYTQKELALSLGVGRSTIAKWEAGIAYPRTPDLPRLAKSLNCTEGEIISAITDARKVEPSPQVEAKQNTA